MPAPSHVVSMIAAADSEGIPATAIEAARAAFAGGSAPSWLSPRRACDLPVTLYSEEDGQERLERLRQAVSALRIDANLLPTVGRRKQLLIADMDATIVEQETLDELAEAVGRRAEVAAITERAMAGELDFKAALRARIALLAGAPVNLIDEVAKRIRLMRGSAVLVSTMRANGAYTALVTGGFAELAGRTAALLGFDAFQANRLRTEDGRIIGVSEPILDKEAKRDALVRHAADRGLAPSDALAVGDGANDVPMLKAAGLGVAFRAKPVVRAHVPVQISHGDLTALLYLQGYTDLDIARAAEVEADSAITERG